MRMASEKEFRRTLLRRLWDFALPALAITLSDPAMGLIDTICIGQLSTTTNLAALGPNTAIFNFLMNGLVFLSYSTMALLGDAQEAPSSLNRQVGAEKLGLMFMMGWGCGLLLTFLLYFTSSSLIEHAGGLPESDAWEPALAYIQGRLWAMPAVCTVIVCQSAMLAQGDARTPCFATLVMLVCNIMMDYSVLYFELGMAGIAWTTVLAQYCGAAALFVLTQKEDIVPVFRRPSWKVLCDTLKTACILFFFKAFKNACFAFTQSSANSLGTDFAAAHQAIWAVWMVAAFCPEPVSQAAQTFLPAWQTHEATLPQVGIATNIFVRVGIALGALLGVTTVFVVCAVPQFLTEDPSLWPLMASVWMPLGLSLFLISPSLVYDGVLLARRHFLYCTVSMAVNTVIVVVFLEIGNRFDWGLKGVWWALVLVQALRLVQGVGKVVCTPVTLRVAEGYKGVPTIE